MPALTADINISKPLSEAKVVELFANCITTLLELGSPIVNLRAGLLVPIPTLPPCSNVMTSKELSSSLIENVVSFP